MSWKYDSIAKQRAEKAAARFAAADRETLIARIVALETALYPYVVALSSVLEKSWRGTTASSKLFPMRPEDSDHKFLVSNLETRKSESIDIPEEKLAEIRYYETESLSIADGSKLGDDFTLLAFHQQAPGAYVGCGSIDVADVKYTLKVFYEPYEAKADQPA
jgi:hypothetical protein